MLDTVSVVLPEPTTDVGCDDALLSSRGGKVYLRFDREAESLGDAIGSAVKDVERAGLTVARVDIGG